MTRDEALQMCLEYIETNAHERRCVRWAIKEALAQPEVFWIGLTEEEIHASKPPISNDAVVWELAVRWAETKLKEKNT